MRRVFEYLAANLWMLIPLLTALIVAAVAANAVGVPAQCPTSADPNNWFLCAEAASPNALQTVLAQGAAQVAATKTKLPADVFKHLANPKKPPEHRVGDPAYTDLKTDITLAAREAGARTSWTAALGTLMLASIIASLGSFWFIGQAIIGRRRSQADPMAQSLTSWQEFYGARWSIAAFLAMAVSLLFIATLVVSLVIGLMFHGAGFDIFAVMRFRNRLIFADEITAWLASYIPDFKWFMDRAAFLLTVGVSLVAVLVSSSLYQEPGDDAFRKTYSDTQPEVANYERYLGRSFGRLKAAIYLGALLMVAAIAEMSAQYSWALSFVPDSDTSKGFGAAMTAYSTGITQQAGFGFTMFLAALYFPAIVIIRGRARDFRRVRYPLETLTEQDNYLKSQGLSLTVPSGFGDMLVLIAPAATSAFANTLFKVLS